jgi:radical SAM superfamily enzyme YgiQ (UPF0313 family)
VDLTTHPRRPSAGQQEGAPVQTGKKIRALLLSPILDNPGELPPHGFLYLAGYLRNHPRIELHVPHCSLTPKDFRALIAEREYDAICTGGMLTFVDTFARYLNAAREIQPQALRVLGGPIVSAFPGERLLRELDFHVGVVGEGEATLEDLLLAHAEGRPFFQVPGVLCRDLAGRAVVTEARKPMDLKVHNLLPDWTVCDVEDYFRRSGCRTLHILGSRGCPNRCHYCNSTIRGYRIRSVDQVMDEIRQTHADYRLDSLNFRDETFMANPRRIREFCRAYIDSGIGLPWGCGLRTNIADAETLRLMRKAGCAEIQYGVESGSERVLKRMNKHVSPADNRRAILDTQAAGINRGVSVMFGYLDETKDDVRATIDLLIETNELPKYYSLTTPVPGTPLYDECAARGLVGDPVEHGRVMNKAIYLAFAPELNMTAIEDGELFPFLREELARLFTAHFRNNHARLLSFDYEHGQGGSCRAACSGCGALLTEAVGHPKWSYQLFCPGCRNHTWVHLADIPAFAEHFDAVSAFLDRVDAQGGNLVLRATANDFVYGNLVKVDPWDRIMRRRPPVLCETPYRFHLPEWDPARTPAGEAWALIMDLDPDGVLAADLAGRGFAPGRIQAVLPPLSSALHYAAAPETRDAGTRSPA